MSFLNCAVVEANDGRQKMFVTQWFKLYKGYAQNIRKISYNNCAKLTCQNNCAHEKEIKFNKYEGVSVVSNMALTELK